MKVFARLPEALKILRKQMRLTQEVASLSIGLHKTAVGKIERREAQPSVDTLDRLMVLYDVSLNDLARLMDGKPIESDPEAELRARQAEEEHIRLDEKRVRAALVEVLLRSLEDDDMIAAAVSRARVRFILNAEADSGA